MRTTPYMNHMVSQLTHGQYGFMIYEGGRFYKHAVSRLRNYLHSDRE